MSKEGNNNKFKFIDAYGDLSTNDEEEDKEDNNVRNRISNNMCKYNRNLLRRDVQVL